MVCALTATALASACSAETRAVDLGERGGSSGGFIAADGGTDGSATADASTSLRLCATSECPAGTTTCETSHARCDIDLQNDRNNCGACGAACPRDSHWDLFSDPADAPFLEVAFFCSSGKCQMVCQSEFGDCDGIPDNGCETSLRWKDNCGACGVKCPGNEPCTDGVCGCPSPKVNCDGYCTNVTTDMQSCGACGNVCSDPSPPPDSFHYWMQCTNSECKRQCETNYADCDHDVTTNGCEQKLDDNNNCGACGNVCPSGTQCEQVDDAWQCGCPAGLRKCTGSSGKSRCRDILTDPNHCGGCDVLCQSGEMGGLALSTNTAICRGGVCGLICKNGLADCNGFTGDGCEIDLQTDPRHCGACGHECDLGLGQPCVKGECVVSACGGGEGVQ
ncbi:Tryptophan synthase alpha chain [Labilithrix luteola]|uniref:Tryptophan synthase alpha chain n=1 Tax=Labilithrix luteola TaxID=1391654 RepID=A0A0K1Q3A7_9BACT|nr:Tryptophan synthase alpha chain [Labilithrix luteola]